jgi:COP9 signalosome complex subunit 7
MDASALGQFVILAQSTQGKACEALVRDAIEHSGVFVFGELLACPNVQALEQTPDGKRLLNLLRIFAFGVYPDFKARKAELPEVSPGQLRKLQLLTIVSMATKEKTIKFADLQAAVEITNTRELEDLLIEAVYQNLLVGKMDQENQCLIVESCVSRDCQDEDLDYIIETLSAWYEDSQGMLKSLDDMVQHSHSSYHKQKQGRDELEKKIQQTRDSLKEGDAGKAGTGDGGCTRMSTDDADEESKRAKSTRGRWLGGVGQTSRGGTR